VAGAGAAQTRQIAQPDGRDRGITRLGIDVGVELVRAAGAFVCLCPLATCAFRLLLGELLAFLRTARLFTGARPELLRFLAAALEPALLRAPAAEEHRGEHDDRDDDDQNDDPGIHASLGSPLAERQTGLGPPQARPSYIGLMGAAHAPVVGLLMVGIVMAGCGSAEQGAAGERTETIRSEALSLEVPPGWYGDAGRPEVPQAPLLRAATFPLAEEAKDSGQQAQRTMGERDILISVVDYGRPSPSWDEVPTSLPVAVHQSDVASFEGFREPVVTRTITLGGHRLQLWVVFGSSDPSEWQYGEANRVLATLAVRPRTLGLGGLTVELLEGWHGFAKDIGPPHDAPTEVLSARLATALKTRTSSRVGSSSR
jgi:hypothetical protein